MSPTPTKRRTLPRQRSSPSLNVGLPPPLPDGSLMSGASPAKSIRRTRSHHRIHRGDVSSSAASSDSDTEELTSRTTPARPALNLDTTPKRKMLGTMEPMSVGRVKTSSSKRPTLADRLQAVAKVRPSKSMDTFDQSIPPVPPLPSTPSRIRIIANPRDPTEEDSPEKAKHQSKNDKVVVCVRVKPTESAFATTAYDITPTSLTLSDTHPNVIKRGGKAGREDEYTYTFDKLLQFPSRTPDLYDAKVAPLVKKAMSGFNSTIFAYGQTGSGKSFTMTGVPEELGIIPCAVDGVFDAINEEPDREYLLRVSYIEIYNETLRDLLNFKKGTLRDDERPAIHTGKGKVYVDPLVENVVSTPQDVVDLLEKGNTMRKVGATDWNERSSRSHSVFTIVIESRPREGDGEDDIRLSRLNLIDLAGSEKAVSDLERRSEGKHINKSLLALREVINKLTEKNRTHVPYRNSKLTHLLENALGGDSNICVICTMSAEEEHCAETLETLKFAGRCSQVETQAKKNVLLSNDKALIRAKDMEIEDLRRRLQSLQDPSFTSSPPNSSEHITDLVESVAAMEERKAKLVAQLAKLNGEILTSEEIPRSMSGILVSSKPKRRRISDFNSMGMGNPKKNMGDRRTVSNMIRVSEEEEIPSMISVLDTGDSSKAFEADIIASLRRALRTKEEELHAARMELSAAISRLSKLVDSEERARALRDRMEALLEENASLRLAQNTTVSEHESKIRDMATQLESTRAELVSVVNDKSSKIDTLEEIILELRRSREDIAIEDQQRYDEVKEQLDEALKRVDEVTFDREAATEKEASIRRALESLEHIKKQFEEDLSRLQREIVDLTRTHSEAVASAESASVRAQELETTLSTVQQQLDNSEHKHDSLQQQIVDLAAGKEAAERGRTEAREDLDRFQQMAMSNETQAVSELKAEISKLREAKEKETEASRQEVDGITRELNEEKKRTEEMSREAEDSKGLVDKTEQALQVLRREKAEMTEEQRRIKEELDSARSTFKQQLDERHQAVADLIGDVEARDQTIAESVKREAVLISARGSGDAREEELSEEIARLKESAKSEVAEERSRTEAALTEVQAMRTQLESLKQREATTLSEQRDSEARQQQLHDELNELKRVTEQTLTDERRRTDSAFFELAAEKARMVEAETREAALLKAKGAEVELRESLEKLLAEGNARLANAMKEIETERNRAIDAEQREAALRQNQIDLSIREQEIREEVVRLKHVTDQAIKEERVRADEAVKELEQARAKAADMEKREMTLLQEKGEVADHERDLAAQVQQNRKIIIKLEKERVAAETALRKEVEAKQAISQQLVAVESNLSKEVGTAASLMMDSQALRTALGAAQADAKLFEEKASISSERASALAKEVAELRASFPTSASTSTITRARHTISASDPLIPSDVVIDTLRAQVLTSASTGDLNTPSAKLATMEGEEIDRLEKIIEAQQVIIEDQKEKIKFWARELEQQREVVRALTMNSDSSPHARSSPRGHMKAKSVSAIESPRPGQAITPKKPFPSTFTAFNLALPTTPTPLPMHATQYDNTSTKKGRRVTIEHDLDILADSSKVNKARAIFDLPGSIPLSPSKTPIHHKRTGSQILGSAPKQRRP